MKKKHLFMLMIMGIIITSCEREESTYANKEPKVEIGDGETIIIKTITGNDVNTRASNNVPYILDQISDIPVNIVNRALNNNNKFLSVTKKGHTVDLFNKDDGSLRQRWFIKPGSRGRRICLQGGHSQIKKAELYIETNTKTLKKTPSLWEEGRPILWLGSGGGGIGTPGQLPTPYFVDGINFMPVNNSPNIYYIETDTRYGFTPPASKRMQIEGSSSLVFSDAVSYNYSDQWEIHPLETFDLIRIRYIMESDDYLQKRFTYGRTYTINNSTSPTPTQSVITLNEKITTQTSFKQNQGLTFGYKMTTTNKVGAPEVNMDMTLSSEYSYGNSFSFEYNKVQTYEKNYQNAVTVQVPAYKKAVVRVIESDYFGQVTYIAEVRSKNTQRVLYIKGKWEGKIGDDICVEPYYENPDGTTEPFTLPGVKNLNEIL